jgi:peptidoglycan/LPS O-acetylase OafA/YrhL
MPALLAFLAVYCLIAPMLWPDEADWYTDALASALYLADYGIAFFDLPNSLLHMWSLSVEEHFYLVWPVLLLVIVRRTPRGQIWCRLFGLFLLAWAWRVFWVTQNQEFYEIFFRFDTRATGLIAGSMLAALVMERPAWFEQLCGKIQNGLWLVLFVPVLMALGWGDMNVMVWAMTLVELAVMVVLIAVLPQRGLVYELLNQPLLIKLGQISYGVYLWHYPVYRALRAHMEWPLVVVLGSAISIALATLSYVTIERWGRGLRDAKPSRREGMALRHTSA